MFAYQDRTVNSSHDVRAADCLHNQPGTQARGTRGARSMQRQGELATVTRPDATDTQDTTGHSLSFLRPDELRTSRHEKVAPHSLSLF